MKRCHSLILTFLAAALLALPTRAYGGEQFAALPFDHTDEGVTTVITDTQGETHEYDGALDVAALPSAQAAKIASYAVVCGDRELLSVTLRGFGEPEGASLLSAELNGYSAVTFAYGDEYEAFLTGLSTDQTAELEQALIDAALKFTDFAPEDVSFIDAEKHSLTPIAGDGGDSELCWAATSSNLLWYTGWGKLVDGVACEDDLMDAFDESFSDGSGNVYYGLEWFFDGYHEPSDSSAARYQETVPDDGENFVWAKRLAPDSGNFLGLSLEHYFENIDLSETGAEAIRSAAEMLREGYGAGLSLKWLNDKGEPDGGGHAVTMWGYIRAKDEDSRAFDKSSYVALLTSDSDSDPTMDAEKPSEDRRDAPNKLLLMPLAPIVVTDEGDVYDTWSVRYWADDSEAQYAALENIFLLEPLTAIGKPDLKVHDLYVSDCAEDIPFREGIRAAFVSGGTFSVCPWFQNSGDVEYGNIQYGDVVYDGYIPYTVELKTGDGYVVKGQGSADFRFGLEPGYNSGDTASRVTLGALEPGEYTVRVTVGDIENEAFTYNNRFEKTFTVTDAPAPDVGDAALTVAGALTYKGKDSVNNDEYALPLSLTGLDTGKIDGYYVTVAQTWQEETGEIFWYDWIKLTAWNADEASPVVIVNNTPRIRLRVLAVPKDAAKPWPVVETEVKLIEWVALAEGENPGEVYVQYGYDLRDRSLSVFCGYTDESVCAAGYDQDGRMVFVREAHYPQYEQNMEIPDNVRTVKLFWVKRGDQNESFTPKCEVITIHGT